MGNILIYLAGIITGVLLFEYGLEYMKQVLTHHEHDIEYDKCTYINKNNLSCDSVEERADSSAVKTTSELERVIERVEGFDSYQSPQPPQTDSDGLFDYEPTIHEDDSVEYITTGREMDIQRQINLRGGY